MRLPERIPYGASTTMVDRLTPTSAGSRTSSLTAGGAADDAVLFRHLVESVTDYAIFALDAAGNILTWNAGARGIKGFSADDIVGRHFSVLYTADDIERGMPERHLEQATIAGRVDDEAWRLRKDGSRFWARVTITALRHDSGELAGFAKVTRDLTERREAERRVRELVERRRVQHQAQLLVRASAVLSQSLERDQTVAAIARLAVPDVADICGIDLIAPDGSIERLATFCHDPEIATILAERDARYPVSLDAPRGTGFVLRTGEIEFIPEITAAMSRAIARDQDHAALTDRLGLTSAIIVPLVAQGVRLGALTLLRTRTSETRYDESDLAFALELAHRAARAIENARLYEVEQNARAEAEHARRRAEEANRAKSEFLAMMSHELRTPLNAIAGYVDLMLAGVGGTISSTHVGYLERIQRNQKHLLGLIEGLLKMAKIEARRIDYRLGPVPVSRLIASLEPILSPLVAKKSVRFISEPCDPELFVNADEEKTLQILLNLLGNAFKFTLAGMVRVAVDATDSEVRIAVTDTGPGIAADKHAAIFEPFLQLDAGLGGDARGVGLGLSISRDLARGMGGDVTVSSDAGEGSAFTLSLPRSPGRS